MLHGQKRLSFDLTIPKRQPYPTPFVTSNGSLTYRIVALIQRDDTWEIFAKKLVNFKGYYNVLHMALSPFVESKLMQTKAGEVVSTFSVPDTVAVMGQCEGLEAVLELRGLSESQVDATLTFFRNISYGGNIHTEIILSQNRHAYIHQSTALFKWTVVVPMMKRSSYSNELVPMYSVRYYLKVCFHYRIEILTFYFHLFNEQYEAFLSQLGAEEQYAGVNGVVEVEIGTARDLCGYTTDDNTNGAVNQNSEINSTHRRKSVMSLVSMLSLPPAYSQLISRSGSMMSLETRK